MVVDYFEKYRELTDLSDEIMRCGRCGFCQSVCPVYDVTGDERGVARGRNMYARELVSGTVNHSRKNETFFSECLLCRACVETCFSAVKTDEIVLAGKRSQRRTQGISPLHKYIFEELLPDHTKLGRFIRLLKIPHRIGLFHLVPGLSLFGWLGASVNRIGKISRDIPDKFLHERLAGRKADVREAKRAMLFIGCGTNFMFPHVGEATIMILEKLGYEVDVVDHGCCGLPAFAHGESAAVSHLARNNIRAFSRERDCIIVTDCSSCASFLKDYPKHLSINDEAGKESISEAERFSARVRDMTELLATEEAMQCLWHEKTGSAEQRQSMSFHDPCHLSRYQNLSSQARQVLRSIPDTKFIEMKQADWCCGGAGAFAFEQPQLSLKILEKKIQNIKSSGADTILTTCPSCLMQMESGIREARLETNIRHLVEVFCERLLE
jgi:glycolate oxidase iron-sulfur subunit